MVLDKSAKMASATQSGRFPCRSVTIRPSVTISSADAAVVWENRYVFVVESNKKKLARLVACATSVPWQILVTSHTLSTRSYIQFVTRVKFERGGCLS